MVTEKLDNRTLEQQIAEINETLKEIQYNQTEEIIILQKNYANYMKKLNKLQEYNKIADMTNQIFEKRLVGIENAIKEINKSIGA